MRALPFSGSQQAGLRVVRSTAASARGPCSLLAPSSSTRSSSGARRGAASIEALLVITMFTLLWVGVRHLGRLSLLEQQALSQARSCAFLIATSGCQNVPTECAAETQNTAPSQEAEDLRDAAKSGTDESEDAEPIQETLSSHVDDGFFKRTSAKAGAKVQRPLQLGQEWVHVKQEFSLPCNPRPGTLGEKLKDTFREMFEKMNKDQESNSSDGMGAR